MSKHEDDHVHVTRGIHSKRVAGLLFQQLYACTDLLTRLYASEASLTEIELKICLDPLETLRTHLVELLEPEQPTP